MNKPINLKPLSHLLRDLVDAKAFNAYAGLNSANGYSGAVAAATRAALDQIDSAIAAAQGKARVRTISAIDIATALAEVEYRLNIPKCAMDGIHVTIDINAQNFPNAYKGIPTSTIFRATYKRDHWTLDAIWRGVTLPASRRFIVEHTAESEKAVMNRFRAWG